MKYQLVLLAASIIVVSGCNSGTSGGPGATPAADRKPDTKVEQLTEPVVNSPVVQNTKDAVLGPDDNTFKLDVPVLETKMKQGETKNLAIGIVRGKNMDQDVTLRFSNLPTGVTIEPATTTIKHGDAEAPISIVAKADAALGDFTVKVVGTPGTGADATNEFTLSIAAM
jgi:hypothetical protein